MARSKFPQGGSESLSSGSNDRLGAGIAFEQGQCWRTTGIGKHQRKLGKQHHQECLDLVLGARTVISELCVQALQFAVRRDQVIGDRARSCFATE